MRLTADDIREGEGYVKDDGSMVRLVYSISNWRVSYRSFWLRDGDYYDTGSCELSSLLKWIGTTGRKATPDEVSRLKIESAENAERRLRDASVQYWLSQATEQELQAELTRRDRD